MGVAVGTMSSHSSCLCDPCGTEGLTPNVPLPLPTLVDAAFPSVELDTWYATEAVDAVDVKCTSFVTPPC